MTTPLHPDRSAAAAADTVRIGEVVGPAEVAWASRDTMLYAIALGVGHEDATRGLEFTTENSSGVQQQVLGTYAAVIAQNAGLPRGLGQVSPARVLHAGQRIKLHRALPPGGRLHVRQSTTALYDKGNGALAVIESTALDGDGELVFESANLSYIRDAGGFGGERGPARVRRSVSRTPDARRTISTTPNQALLYRLCGDRNPLHSDPVFAERAGFERPILHGLVTLGVAAMAVAELAGLPLQLEGCELSARFTRSVYPGETLHVDAWHEEGGDIVFVVRSEEGVELLSEGHLGRFDVVASRTDHPSSTVSPPEQ